MDAEASMTAAALAKLVRAFPRTDMTADTVNTYLDALADIPDTLAHAAVEQIICTRTNPWMPTVAEIRHTAAEIALALPTEGEAQDQVRNLAEWAVERVDGLPRPSLDPTVRVALDRIGGLPVWRDPYGRAEFAKAYRHAREQRILEYVAPRAQLHAGVNRPELQP
jgi:hypothetical protein